MIKAVDFPGVFFKTKMRSGLFGSAFQAGCGFHALAARPQAQRGFPALAARPHRSSVRRPRALWSAAGGESNSSNEAPHSKTRWAQYCAQMAVSGAALGPLLDGYHSAFGVLVSERARARMCESSLSRLTRLRACAMPTWSERAHVCKHARTHACVYVWHACVYVCVCVRARTNTHTHTHTHTHTYTYTEVHPPKASHAGVCLCVRDGFLGPAHVRPRRRNPRCRLPAARRKARRARAAAASSGVGNPHLHLLLLPAVLHQWPSHVGRRRGGAAAHYTGSDCCRLLVGVGSHAYRGYYGSCYRVGWACGRGGAAARVSCRLWVGALPLQQPGRPGNSPLDILGICLRRASRWGPCARTLELLASPSLLACRGGRG